MNERIRELYDQANISYSVYEILKPRDERKSIPDIFAELIVRECYEHCKGQILPKEMAEKHGVNYNDGVMDCAIGLLQHFGVE